VTLRGGHDCSLFAETMGQHVQEEPLKLEFSLSVSLSVSAETELSRRISASVPPLFGSTCSSASSDLSHPSFLITNTSQLQPFVRRDQLTAPRRSQRQRRRANNTLYVTSLLPLLTVHKRL
jgi:hypothetical protein